MVLFQRIFFIADNQLSSTHAAKQVWMAFVHNSRSMYKIDRRGGGSSNGSLGNFLLKKYQFCRKIGVNYKIDGGGEF